MTLDPTVGFSEKVTEGGQALSVPPKTWTALFPAFALPEGAGEIDAWVSADLPENPRATLRTAVRIATPGTPAWSQAVHAAVLFLLEKAPVWKFRVVRYPEGKPIDPTWRDVRELVEVDDWAATYHCGLHVEPGTTYEVQVWHNADFPIVLDAYIEKGVRRLVESR